MLASEDTNRGNDSTATRHKVHIKRSGPADIALSKRDPPAANVDTVPSDSDERSDTASSHSVATSSPSNDAESVDLHKKDGNESTWLKGKTPYQMFVHQIKFAPLVGAVAAPISTIFAIPALTQNWYTVNGAPAPDPGVSLALSAVCLATNLIANIALILRFTVSEERWRHMTITSIVCWWINLIFAVSNLAVYGALSRNTPNYVYDEGFWCAVGALSIGGIITLTLTIHYISRSDRPSNAGALIRVAGAEFIIVVSAFLGLLALEGLIVSRIERWTYFQGFYFALVTAFTIGFGDFEPVYNATRVLLFPFAAMSIALLTVQVGVLVNFISANAERRRSRQHHTRAAQVPNERALVEEVDEIQKMDQNEARKGRLIRLGWGTLGLVAFWLVGGSVFMAIEGWAFGTSMYFCYIFFLTIGYGDFSPQTPGGRVFFVVYALFAVPIVTNFVLETVTNLIASMASRRFERARDRRAPTTAERRKFHSHAHNVESSSQRLDDHFAKTHLTGKESEKEIAQIVLGLALRLEAQATTLLIATLESDHKAKTLLRADRNLQLRAVRNFEHVEAHGETYMTAGVLALEKEMQEEVDQSEDVARDYLDPSTGKTDQLELVRRYRETFGGLLAAGSRLMELDGEQRLRFERRLEGEADKDAGGLLLGAGRRGPAEEEFGVDV